MFTSIKNNLQKPSIILQSQVFLIYFWYDSDIKAQIFKAIYDLQKNRSFNARKDKFTQLKSVDHIIQKEKKTYYYLLNKKSYLNIKTIPFFVVNYQNETLIQIELEKYKKFRKCVMVSIQKADTINSYLII